MSFDEPTQRLRRPSPPQQPTPATIDLTRHDAKEPSQDSDPTGVLPLDELLGPPEPAQAGEAAEAEAPVALNRPPRGPMPVVSVRSGTETDRSGTETETENETAPTNREPERSTPAANRLRADGAAAVHASVQQVSGWLRRDDNALTLVTALVAILLLSVVAAFGS